MALAKAFGAGMEKVLGRCAHAGQWNEEQGLSGGDEEGVESGAGGIRGLLCAGAGAEPGGAGGGLPEAD